MNKIITILLTITLLSSCNSIISNNDNLVIHSKKPTTDSRCAYEVDNFGMDVVIIYPCDMWNIGDTIKLTK